MATSWTPLDAKGAPIDDSVDGASGLWLCESADLVATDAAGRVALWTGDALPAIFPRNWPASFKSSKPLKTLIGKSMLNGSRCRAVQPPTPAEMAAAGSVRIHPLHSFANAEALVANTGWKLIKGMLIVPQ